MNKSTDGENLSPGNLTNEVLKLKREIFELRFKKATRQNIKPHLFKTTKHRLAKLLTPQNKANSK